MLGRSADREYVDANIGSLTQLNDISRAHWAYYEVMEGRQRARLRHCEWQRGLEISKEEGASAPSIETAKQPRPGQTPGRIVLRRIELYIELS